jgi:hypothetical protein
MAAGQQQAILQRRARRPYRDARAHSQRTGTLCNGLHLLGARAGIAVACDALLKGAGLLCAACEQMECHRRHMSALDALYRRHNGKVQR